MAAFVILEPPPAVSGDPAEQAVFVRDGFSLPAFIVPPLWMLWHRLWIEAIAAFGAMAAISTLAEMAGAGPAGSLASLLVSFYAGLEGNGLRVAALRRRGWLDWGVVEADTLDDAETRYAVLRDAEPNAVAPEVGLPWTRAAPAAAASADGPVFGLFDYPRGA